MSRVRNWSVPRTCGIHRCCDRFSPSSVYGKSANGVLSYVQKHALKRNPIKRIYKCACRHTRDAKTIRRMNGPWTRPTKTRGLLKRQRNTKRTFRTNNATSIVTLVKLQDLYPPQESCLNRNCKTRILRYLRPTQMYTIHMCIHAEAERNLKRMRFLQYCKYEI